jgi:hypothetical protein
MPQAARAQDSWSDPPRRPRRQAADWASPEDLEILGSIGRPREADWTVLTLEREDAPDVMSDVPEDEPSQAVVIDHPAARMARRPGRAPAPEYDLDPHYEDEPEPAYLQAVPATPAPLDLPERAANGRRTVVVRGRGAERDNPEYASTAQRHRPARRPSERVGHRPDRVALWAFGLGLLLILVAVLSATGA